MSSRTLLLVYTCSGCSSVAQAANRLVVGLDRVGRAEMFCTSGIGDGVRAPVKTARSGRPIPAFDGCTLTCVRVCPAAVGVAPDVRLVLNQCGAKKCHYADCSDDELSVIAVLADDAVNTLKHRPGTVGD